MNNVNALAAAAYLLPARDQDFAKSLLSQFAKKGSLSVAQMVWVDKLLAKTLADTTPTVKVDLSRVNALFATASANGLKNPKVKLAGFTLSPAKATSVNYGSTYVKQGMTYLGKVSPDGGFHAANDAGDLAGKVAEVLALFAADPAQAAAAHGHATGSCCFCAKELTDAGSLEVGYGPVCASKYGLPHQPAGHGVKVSVAEDDLAKRCSRVVTSSEFDVPRKWPSDDNYCA